MYVQDLVSRHFAAASLSLKVTRSFDAVRMLTMSCLAALTDVVMRVVACDTPSPCSLHYSGRAKGEDIMYTAVSSALRIVWPCLKVQEDVQRRLFHIDVAVHIYFHSSY